MTPFKKKTYRTYPLMNYFCIPPEPRKYLFDLRSNLEFLVKFEVSFFI